MRAAVVLLFFGIKEEMGIWRRRFNCAPGGLE
jgi:hypothetical protein